MRATYGLILIIITGIFLSSPAYAIKIGLLDDVNKTAVAVSSAGAVFDSRTGREVYKLEPMKRYPLKVHRNKIAINIEGKYYTLGTDNVTIRTQEPRGFVFVKGRWYRQNLIISKKFDGLTVINDIDLELYLLGVVPAEMPSGWNFEAHKAQAIAARSYAVANLGKRAARGYDLKDTPEDQAYGGANSETKRTNNAVIETQGQVLVCNNKVISAYYHASSGGQTKNSGKVWNQNLPYLKSVSGFDMGVPKKGHGVGMSQYGANNLANNGYNAYQILAHYYTNVTLAQIN
ncbi:MAG: SpoIID/LytB domain-containing protein [Candidatus Gastranaerophilales bacterium]|nr:SpoIID/LytB domain-containing protein [Candidatus Gastranaerophilales bacterium]